MTDERKWYQRVGRENDVACSSRVRLARNLTGYPFPSRCNQRQKDEILEKVREAFLSASSLVQKDFSFIPLVSLTQEEAVSMVERHIVSPGFISDAAGKALLLSKDESISIMINEEDHLRIQVIREGLCTKEAYQMAERIDRLLSERLNFAFDNDLGYLTHCPTNLGTALRVSVMLHLPALSEFRMIPRLTANLAKLGMIIRGTYGEGTEVSGDLYQLSNQVTLGLSEETALENLHAIALQLLKEERDQREQMMRNLSAKDRIYRCIGILKYARLLTTGEFMKYISNVRLGLSMNLLEGMTMAEVNQLVIDVQPATLMTHAGGRISQKERDRLRGDLVRTVCKGLAEKTM